MLTNKALAATSFVGGPEDDLATADVYKIDTDAVINNLPSTDFSSSDTSTSDELRGGLAMSSSLPINSNSLLSGASSLTGGSSSSLLGKITSLGSSALNAVGGVGGLVKLATAKSGSGPSLMSRLSGGGLNGIPGLQQGGLTSLTSVLGNNSLSPSLSSSFNSPINNNLGSYVSYGGQTSRLNTTQMGSSYQISSLINSVVGGSNQTSIVDKDSTVRLISGLSGAGMSSGMPNAFSSVSPLAGGDKSILAAAAGIAMSLATKSGNVGAMRNIVTTVGPATMQPVSGSMFSSVASNYRLTAPTTAVGHQQSTQDFNDVTSTFSSVNPGWATNDRYVTNPSTPGQYTLESGVDLSVANNGSADFCSMMRQGAQTTTDPKLEYFSMARMFPPTSPEQDLKSSFPQTYTTIQSDTRASIDESDDDDNSLEGDLLLTGSDDSSNSAAA